MVEQYIFIVELLMYKILRVVLYILIMILNNLQVLWACIILLLVCSSVCSESNTTDGINKIGSSVKG